MVPASSPSGESHALAVCRMVLVKNQSRDSMNQRLTGLNRLAWLGLLNVLGNMMGRGWSPSEGCECLRSDLREFNLFTIEADVVQESARLSFGSIVRRRTMPGANLRILDRPQPLSLRDGPQRK